MNPRRISIASLLLFALAGSAAAEPPAGLDRALDFTVMLEGNGRYGAGVLIDPRAGLVITALHVVDQMSAPRVTFHDGRQARAELVASDRTLDLALLSVPPKTFAAPVFAAAHLQPGDELYAIGCPRRLAFSVARGIVSYVGRELDGVRWLQSDLPINVGDSGGPVIDRAGRWVAMTSFVLREGQGLSFALPASTIVRRFSRWLSSGHPLDGERVEPAVPAVQAPPGAQGSDERDRPTENRP